MNIKPEASPTEKRVLARHPSVPVEPVVELADSIRRIDGVARATISDRGGPLRLEVQPTRGVDPKVIDALAAIEANPTPLPLRRLPAADVA